MLPSVFVRLSGGTHCSAPAPSLFPNPSAGRPRDPVASQAIAHAHGHDLPDDGHRLDFAVARLAEDSGGHVRPVIEIHVIRQGMDPGPRQRIARRMNSRKLDYFRAVRFVTLWQFMHFSTGGRPPASTCRLRNGNTRTASAGSRHGAGGRRDRLRRSIAADEPVGAA